MWSAEEFHPTLSHIWQACQDPLHTLEKGNARVCASCSPSVVAQVQWQLVAEAAGGSFPRIVPPDPAILPGQTLQQNLPVSPAARHSAAPGDPWRALSSSLRRDKQQHTRVPAQPACDTPRLSDCAVPGTEPCQGLLLPGSGRVPGPRNQPSALETLYVEPGVGWFSHNTRNKQCYIVNLR